MNISVKKTTRLVLALCKLHNYCIKMSDLKIEQQKELDLASIVLEGGYSLPRLDGHESNWTYDMSDDTIDHLNTLLDGGNHTDDHNKYQRRIEDHVVLPCRKIFDFVCDKGLRRLARSNSLARRNS
jgi:hypothetical protein